MALDDVRDGLGFAFALLVAAWFVLHFFLRSCTRLGCYDSLLGTVLLDLGGVGRLLVEVATVGEYVLAGVAVIGLAVAALRDRIPS